MDRDQINPEAIKTVEHISFRWKQPNKEILKHVFPLLAKGQPVSSIELAKVSGNPLADVKDALDNVSAGKDQQKRVPELFGVMLDPTLHRIEVDGVIIFSCCALIANIIARLINKNMLIESVDPISREIAKLFFGPEGIASFSPKEAVATLVKTDLDDILEDVSANFCIHVHHFVSRESAERFIQEDHRRYIVGLDEYHKIGRNLSIKIWNQ